MDQITIEVTQASLDRAAVLVSSYDAEHHHPKDVVRAILGAMRARRRSFRDKGGFEK
jgi:hypothetical protein